MNFHCCWQQCNVTITIILDIASETNRDIRSGNWWSGHGPLLSSPMIMQMHVEREDPVSVLSVQAHTVSLLTLKRRIKSHLPFAGIIRISPYSPRFQDKG
jgi:hypothetical protein